MDDTPQDDTTYGDSTRGETNTASTTALAAFKKTRELLDEALARLANVVEPIRAPRAIEV